MFLPIEKFQNNNLILIIKLRENGIEMDNCVMGKTKKHNFHDNNIYNI